jgi:hypothetical protein
MTLTRVALGAIAMLPAAVASPIGTVDFVGIGNIRVTLMDIDFAPPGGGTGTVLVTGGTDDYTSVIGTIGTITDLSLAAAPPGPPLATPVDPFLLLPSAPRFVFTLDQILLGGGPSCAVFPPPGFNCTPSNLVPNSPFLLTQNSGSVAVQMNVRGTVTDLADPSAPPALYNGLFTANLTRPEVDTIAEVLAALGPGGAGFVESSWSAEFTATSIIPEPSTWGFGLAGLGMVGMMQLVRRRKQR